MRIRLAPESVPLLAVLAAGVAIHEGAHALVLNAAGTTTRFKFYGIAAATDYRDSERQPGARTILVTLVAGPVAELAFYSQESVVGGHGKADGRVPCCGGPGRVDEDVRDDDPGDDHESPAGYLATHAATPEAVPPD